MCRVSGVWKLHSQQQGCTARSVCNSLPCKPHSPFEVQGSKGCATQFESKPRAQKASMGHPTTATKDETGSRTCLRQSVDASRPTRGMPDSWRSRAGQRRLALHQFGP